MSKSKTRAKHWATKPKGVCWMCARPVRECMCKTPEAVPFTVAKAGYGYYISHLMEEVEENESKN